MALLVNNLGSTSDLEINIVAGEAIKLLGSADMFYLRFYILRSGSRALSANLA